MLVKQKLIEDNMKLVYALISKEYPNFVNDEDVVQSGMVGLCKAARSYDESKSKFSTYAYPAIRTAIQDELRKRAKHIGVLSLDHPYENDHGETCTFADILVGEEDIKYLDLDVDDDSLTTKQKAIYELKKRGVPTTEVAKAMGVSRQTVWATMRKIKKLRG